MTHEIDLGDDDGFVVIKAEGAEVRKDLYELNNALHDYHTKNAKLGMLQYNAGLQQMLESMGLPAGMSHFQVARLAQQVVARVAELKKKLEATPESPASTASTPSS